MFDYFGLWTTVMLPAYFITGYLVFINYKTYNLSEHVILYVYAFGLMNVVTAISTPLLMYFNISFLNFTVPVAFLSTIQIAWYYKRIFKMSLGKIILKTMIAIPIYLIVNLIYIALVAALIFGIFKIFIPEMSLPSIEIK